MTITSPVPHRLLFLLVLALLCLSVGTAPTKEKTLSWKPIEDALLRVNDAAPKDWGAYQTSKKTDRVLLQIGNRYLLIEFHDRQIFEIDPMKVQHKSSELLWNPDDRPAQPIDTSEWSTDDIGGAFGITTKLNAENHMLNLQLPHPPDIGNLPARSAAPTRHTNY